MRRVLVVEDEDSIRELIALNLRMADYEVLEAESAEKALALLGSEGGCDAAGPAIIPRRAGVGPHPCGGRRNVIRLK